MHDNFETILPDLKTLDEMSRAEQTRSVDVASQDVTDGGLVEVSVQLLDKASRCPDIIGAAMAEVVSDLSPENADIEDAIAEMRLTAWNRNQIVEQVAGLVENTSQLTEARYQYCRIVLGRLAGDQVADQSIVQQRRVKMQVLAWHDHRAECEEPAREKIRRTLWRANGRPKPATQQMFDLAPFLQERLLAYRPDPTGGRLRRWWTEVRADVLRLGPAATFSFAIALTAVLIGVGMWVAARRNVRDFQGQLDNLRRDLVPITTSSDDFEEKWKQTVAELEAAQARNEELSETVTEHQAAKAAAEDFEQKWQQTAADLQAAQTRVGELSNAVAKYESPDVVKRLAEEIGTEEARKKLEGLRLVILPHPLAVHLETVLTDPKAPFDVVPTVISLPNLEANTLSAYYTSERDFAFLKDKIQDFDWNNLVAVTVEPLGNAGQSRVCFYRLASAQTLLTVDGPTVSFPKDYVADVRYHLRRPSQPDKAYNTALWKAKTATDPRQFGEAVLLMGLARYFDGEYPEAVSLLMQAGEHLEKSDLQQSIESLVGEALDPKAEHEQVFARGLMLQSLIYTALGDAERAKASFDRAKQWDPDVTTLSYPQLAAAGE